MGWAGGGRINLRPDIAGLAGFPPTCILASCVTWGKSGCTSGSQFPRCSYFPSAHQVEMRLTMGEGRGGRCATTILVM